EAGGKSAEDHSKRLTYQMALLHAKARDVGTSLNDKELAERLVGPEPEAGTREHEVWAGFVKKARGEVKQAHGNAKRNPARWAIGLFQYTVPVGGDEPQYRWFDPASYLEGSDGH